MKCLSDELEKVCSVFVCLCVYVRVVRQFIASNPFVVLSSVAPHKHTSLSSEPVSKEEKNKNKVENQSVCL